MGVQSLDEISVNLDQQSTLARLLANENISVIHGAYKTAWFDPEKRVLALPIWKNKGKAVYDLLTGHEVGHALYTPAIGWHDAVDDVLGAPKAYLNVLEDVRIERKVQDRYPGLRSQFQKAYKLLAEEDFFGIRSHNIDLDNMMLIDRINLKAKLGQNIDVPFDAIGRMFFAKAQKAETFDEVVALAIEIYQYQKALNENAEEGDGDARRVVTLPDSDQDDSTADEEPAEQETSSQNDYEKPQSTNEEPTPEEESPFEKTGNGQRDQDAIQEELAKEDFTDAPSTIETEDEPDISMESLTDKAFRNNEKNLIADNLGDTMVYTINKIKQPNVVIDYKEYYAAWKNDITTGHEYAAERCIEEVVLLTTQYLKFKKDTDMAAAYMAKEFELRKAAYQYSRSSVQKTGVINTNKLHSYKYNEDIFLKSTKLANYKNHGMMMFIDFSGSMQDNIGATIRQVLNLTSFCRMIDVPYEVYAFTTKIREDDYDNNNAYQQFSDCEVVPQKFNLINLMSSRMTRSEYQEGQRMLWNLSMAWDGKLTQYYISKMNHLHSTPLNTCIVYANTMIKAFKLKNNIEKMTTMFLTDGESDSFQVRITDAGDEHRSGTNSYYSSRSRNAIVRVDGHTFTVPGLNGPKVTKELLHILKKSTGSNVIGFFLSEYRNQAINKVMGEMQSTNYIKNKEKYTHQMTKNRCVIEDDIFGYDRYFGLCSKYIDLVEDEFGELVEDGASKSKIKTAFAKMTKQKRVNRILLNAFVDSIA